MATCDMSDVHGSFVPVIDATIDALRCRENILYIGPPGIGKTMIARRIPTVLPPLSEFESGVLTERYRRAGLGGRAGVFCDVDGVVTERPFRAPHHTISIAGLVGTARPFRVGEVQLAEYGVLFLDEWPEFSGDAISCVAMSKDDGLIIVATANRCPCGWLDSPRMRCACGAGAIERYRMRLASFVALINCRRIEVDPVERDEWNGPEYCPSSAQLRRRMEDESAV